jgi:hypothetical protein
VPVLRVSHIEDEGEDDWTHGVLMGGEQIRTWVLMHAGHMETTGSPCMETCVHMGEISAAYSAPGLQPPLHSTS